MLGRLVRASRVLQYYPSDHPQVTNTLGPRLEELTSLVNKGTALVLKVMPDGLRHDDLLVLPELPAEGPFGRNLLEFGITAIVLKPGIDTSELFALLELLTTTARELEKMGGMQKLVRKKKWAHIRLEMHDFSLAEDEVLVRSFEAMSEEESETTRHIMISWLMEAGEAPGKKDLARVMALHRRAGSVRELVESIKEVEEAMDDVGVLRILCALRSALGDASLNLPLAEEALNKDVFIFDPQVILDMFTKENGVKSQGPLSLLAHIEPATAGMLIADQLREHPEATATWIDLINQLVRRTSDRKRIFYSAAENLKTSDSSLDALETLENELGESGKRERAFLSLFQGTQGKERAQSAWAGRWQSPQIVRRAMGLLERLQISGETRREWISAELDRLLAARDIYGVIELLEGARDRGLPPSSDYGEYLISAKALISLPEFLRGLDGEMRRRFLAALAGLEPRWRHIVGSLLDESPAQEFNDLVRYLEEGRIEVRELILELLDQEKTDELVRGIRLLARLGHPEDVEVLLPFLQHGDAALRKEVIHVLSEIAPRELARLIPDSLKDPNPLVARAALSVAPSLPEIVDVLVEHATKGWLRSVPEEIGLGVVQIIAQHGSLEQRAEFAAAALSSSFMGRGVPSAVRQATQQFLEEESHGELGFIESEGEQNESEAADE